MTVSFAGDIEPLFRPGDVSCMDRWDILLNDYNYMSDPAPNQDFADHAHARQVYFRLTPESGAKRMPKGGPYWSAQNLALYKRWMDEGFAP
jgi:hypothetical protein